MCSKTAYFEIADHRVAMFWQCPYCEDSNAWYGPVGIKTTVHLLLVRILIM